MATAPSSLWPAWILPDDAYRQIWARVRPAFLASLAKQRIPSALAEPLARVYLPLAAWVVAHKMDGPFVLGVNGAQGSGKSTLCEFLALILREGYECKVAGFSIDDIYKTRAERERLAGSVHPLLVTRGVPGTHDVSLGLETLDRLTTAGMESPVALPAFDKSVDDRRPKSAWHLTAAPVDIVIFEGWCVGCVPQTQEELVCPINALEAEEDKDGRWRTHVNEQLAGPYAELFGRLDRLIMLKVPGMECVHRWRGLQERKLAAAVQDSSSPGGRLMDETALRRFIMHYERLTRHMLAEMPARADVTLFLDDNHRFARIHINE
jgi:D-glycerate 3-kinase